jgi:hypothetical protein
MIENKEQIQIELSQLIHQDIVKIVTYYSQKSLLNLELLSTLIQDINLLKTYNVNYIHNEELDEIIMIVKNELKDLCTSRAVALLGCFEYLLNTNSDFKQILYINLTLRVPSEIFLESFSFFNIVVPNIKELFQDFITYIFNDKFLALDENIQIDCIYKIWSFSQKIYHDNDASKFAYEKLKLLFDKALLFDKTEVAFWLYYTPLHYFHSGTGSNIDELNEKFKNEIEKPLEKYIIEKLVPKYNIVPNIRNINKDEKIKVAFILQRIIRHSTIKVCFSLIKAILSNPNNKYEFILYDLAFPESGGSDNIVVEEFESLGVKYINLHKILFESNSPIYSLLEKSLRVREQLIADNIDILIGLHTRIEYLFLYATRTAPVQIYWYHSSNAQYAISGIDYRIKHGDFDQNQVEHDKYKFLQFGDILDKSYLDPDIDSNQLKSELTLYPSNCVVLGTIGRLSKIDSDEYIKIIDEILLNLDNVIYIAAGFGDKESFVSKINKNNLNKWFFPGPVDPHLYGYIIDIWPNTFPQPQGLSTLEFMSKAKPVLTMKNNFHDFEVQNEWNKKRTDKFKDFKMNTETFEEYKRSLELLIINKEARSLLGQINLDYVKNNYYNTTKSLNRFYEILGEVIS